MKNILLLLSIIPSFLFAQDITISGKVIDADTEEGLPFCNVFFKDTGKGVSTDIDGFYTITFDLSEVGDSISVSAIGYDERSKKISKEDNQNIVFRMGASELTLVEVVVDAGENPAHPIVRGIIANRPQNRVNNINSYQCEQYTKMELDLHNIDQKMRESKLFKPFQFIFENIDSTSDEKPFLPAYITETVTDKFHVKDQEDKEVIKAQRVSGVDNKTVIEFINSMHQKYDIYDEWISILDKQFASPFSDLGFHYYEYYIMDSVLVEGEKYFQLKFKPKRKQENTFYGNFFVKENEWAVQRIDMRMSPDVNINLVQRIIIFEEYAQPNGSNWVPIRKKMLLDFATTKSTPGLIGRKTTTYKNYSIDKTEILNSYTESSTESKPLEELEKNSEFWQEARHEKLSENEQKIYLMVDSIKKVPIYKTYVDVIQTIVTGYKTIGNFEFGPYFQLYSNNAVEGNRFRLGIRTNSGFNKNIKLGVYGAYGTKDEQFKYGGSLLWLISKNPRRKLELSYMDDVKLSSGSSEDFGEGNLFSGIYRRNLYQKLIYTREWKVAYEHFWTNDFSSRASIIGRYLDPYGNISPDGLNDGNGFNYKYLPNPEAISQYDTTITATEVMFSIRYAKGETFLESNFGRTSLGTNNAIFELRYTSGVQGLLGGKYDYHRLNFSVKDWFNINPIGWSEFYVEGGYVFGEAPFLLLGVHPGNETYFHSPKGFNGINKYEFVSDKYVSWVYDHHFDGFILNKIPLLRKLKWRTVATFRGIYGDMSEENLSHNKLNVYDETLDGRDTYTGFRVPNQDPYMEAGVGIENILKFIRVDALWRLNYLDNADADPFTLRVGMNFYF